MENSIDRIKELFLKHLHEDISDAEQQELDAFLSQSEQNRALLDTFSDEEKLKERLKEYGQQIDDEAGWKKIMGKLHEAPVKQVQRFSSMKYAAAAMVLLTAGISVYLFFFNKPKNDLVNNTGNQKLPVTAIVPGVDRATLKLDDGTVIVLDQTKDGQITQQANTIVNKQGGKLVYEESQNSIEHSSLTFNTLSTKRGEQYQLGLQDGTRVFLNAASELRFPVSFSGSERIVELVSGEAFFDVAKNKLKPFRVVVSSGKTHSKRQIVEVLGTSFNIMAYQDERAIKTTLLEGSIKLTTSSNMQVLSPGQQASVSNVKESSIDVNKNADTEEAVAWKNGTISFTKADIRSVLRQISRWYNVDVEFDPNVPDREFTASFSRKASIEEVMQMFKYLQIHCKIEERKIVVIP